MRTAEDFQNAARERGITSWPLHNCTFCRYPVGYVFTAEGVFFDTGCYCVSRMDTPRGESWEIVARHYNQQDNADVIAQYDQFWGFIPSPPTDRGPPRARRMRNYGS